jgi:hypothetical protein
MRRKKIKFSPKLQSSSLDDIKRFVPKNALDTSVISNYNTLPTSYQKGGVTNPQSDYNLKRAKELGYTRDETGHMLSVDHETGMWLKSKKHPTAYKEYISMMLNPDVKAVVNPEGYFGENQLQYVPRHQKGGLPKYQNAGLETDPPVKKYATKPIKEKSFGDRWSDFEKSKVGKIVDARGLRGDAEYLMGNIGDYFGYENTAEDARRMALDATAIVNPIPDLINAADHAQQGKLLDAGLYAGFGILPGAAGPIVNRVKPYLNSAGRKVKNLGREALYKGVNPVGYGVKEKIKRAPKELLRNMFASDTERAFRIGHHLRRNDMFNVPGLSHNTAFEKGINWEPPSLKSSIKLRKKILNTPQAQRSPEDLKFLTEMDHTLATGKQRLDAWSLGLKGTQPFNTLQKIGDDLYRMNPHTMRPSAYRLAEQGEVTKNYFKSLDDFKSKNILGLNDFKFKEQLRNSISNKKVLQAIRTGDTNPLDYRDMGNVERKYGDVPFNYNVSHHPDKTVEKFSDRLRFHEIGDDRALRGLYTTDVTPMKGGLQKVVQEDVWDLHPFRNKKWAPKALKELEMFEAFGGKPFTLRNTFEVDPNKGYKIIDSYRDGGLHRYQTGGTVVTDYDKNWDYKKEDGVVYTKRKDADKWISPKVGSVAELAIQKNVFGSPTELEEAVQMPIPEAPELNIAPPQAIGDTIPEVAPLPIEATPEAPSQGMVPDLSMPDISMPDIDMPELSLSEKLLQAQGMLGSLWEDAKDVGEGIIDDVASAGSTVSTFLQDTVEDINEEVTDAIKFKKEAEETVAAKSQQISNYLSNIFTPDSEEAEPTSPEQAPAKKSRTEAFAEMLRGSVPDMPDMPELTGSPVDALMNPIGLSVGLPVAGAMGLYDKLKGIEVPDLPDVTLPKMQMPDVSIPDLPDLPDVSMPDIEVPKVSLPDMPDISMPDMPDVGEFTGYAKEVISDAVESGQSSLSDLKNFFKGELIDYAKDFKETGENIKEGIDSAIDAAKDLPELLSSIADVEKEVKKERGDSGAPGPPPEVEPDLVLSPEDAAPKETFEEMLVNAANNLESGHILDSTNGVMYRIENGEITKKMETIVGKNTALHKGAVPQIAYAAKFRKNWYNENGSLRMFETPEGLKSGPEIKKEKLWEKYGGGSTTAGIYEFTHQPIKGYEKYPGYNSYLRALPGTPTNFTQTTYRDEDGKLHALGSMMGYHQVPNRLKEVRNKALKDLNISNALSDGCIQNSECDNKDMGILLRSEPTLADTLVILSADIGDLSMSAIDNLAKSFDDAKGEKEKSRVLQKLQALATPD